MVGATCAAIWRIQLSKDNIADRIEIHRAFQAASSTNSWPAVELSVFIYSRDEKIFVAAYAANANHRFRNSTSTFSKTIQTVVSFEEAEVLAKKCLNNPCDVLPLSDIENSRHGDRMIEQLGSMQVVSEINGSCSSLPDWLGLAKLAKTRQLNITLALGQSLIKAVMDTRPISGELAQTLQYYISNVPLAVGHWGSFKSLFKALERRDGSADLYGLAIARIDSGIARPMEHSSLVEDLKFLRPLFSAPVASHATMSYLARRGRRVIRNLSEREPDTYASCASAFLFAADDFGGHIDVKNRRILSEVLYGRGASDNSHGRRSLELPTATQRYRRRWDRAPKLWNSRLGPVARLWSNCKNIADIQIWAFNVLKSQKAKIPKLNSSGLRLALVSPHPDIRRQACAQVAGNPQQFLRLDTSAAVAFLSFSTDRQFRAIRLTLEQHSVNKTVRDSISGFLNDHGLPVIFRGERPRDVNYRIERLLSFTFRDLRDGLSEAEALNLGLYIGETNGFRPVSLWRESLNTLPVNTLVELRLRLPGLSGAAKKAVDDACRVAFRSNGDLRLAMALVNSPTAALRKLAWTALSSKSVGAEDLIATWRSLLDFSKTQDDLLRLRECVLDRDRFQTLLSHPDRAPVLSQISIVLAPTQHNASKRALFALADANDPAVILETLNTIATNCQSWPWQQEKTLLRALIAKSDNVLSLIWQGLSEGHYERMVDKIRPANGVFKPMLDVIGPEEIVSIVPAQARLLSSLLSHDPAGLARSRDLSIAAATCPALEVASTAITILEARDKVKSIFMQLLESRLPVAMRAAQRHLETLTNRGTLTKAIIAVCDSGVREAREHGVVMLRERQGEYNIKEIYTALAEHKSPEIAAEVARHALRDGQMKQQAIEKFDRRILRTRRQSRKAKELVKERLGRASIPEFLPMNVVPDVAAERIESLMAMARGRSQRDREWALRELVRLSEKGLDIPLLEVSRTTA